MALIDLETTIESLRARIAALEKANEDRLVTTKTLLDTLALVKDFDCVKVIGRLDALENRVARNESRTFAANKRLDALENRVARCGPDNEPDHPCDCEKVRQGKIEVLTEVARYIADTIGEARYTIDLCDVGDYIDRMVAELRGGK